MKKTLLSTLLLPSLALASNDTQQLETVQVTAKGLDDSLNRNLQDAEVLYTDELMGSYSTVGDVLASLNGVSLSSYGTRGQKQNLTIDGLNNSQALILLNGQAIGSATLGETSFHLIPVNQIERIEVLRGSGSILYGSAAMAGVINIVTKTAPSVDVSIGLGSRNSKLSSVQARKSLASNITAGLSWSMETTDGQNAREGEYVDWTTSENIEYDNDSDGFINNTVNAYANMDITSNLRWNTSAYRSSGTYEYDNSEDDDQSTYKNTQYGSELIYDSGVVSASLKGSRQSDVSANYGNALSRSDADRYATISDIVSAQGLYNFGISELIIGADWRNDYVGDSDLSENYDEESTLTKGTFGILSLAPTKGVTLSAGTRRDVHSEFGTHLSYSAKLELAYSHHRIITSQQTGFKAPTFNDLYFPASTYAQSNPDLQPELSKTKYIKYSFNTTASTFSVKLLRHDLTDQITWEQDPDTFNWSPNNVESSNIETTQITWQENWSPTLSTVFATDKTIATNNEDNERLAYVPEYSSSLSANWSSSVYGASMQVTRVGARLNSARNEMLRPYTVINVGLSAKPIKNLSTSLTADNLLDREYTPNTDYTGKRFGIFANLTYSI